MGTITADEQHSDAAPDPSRPVLSRAAVGVPSSAIRDLLAVAGAPDVVSLAGGIPDDGLLPVDGLREALGRIAGSPGALSYGTTQGDERLREWIAEHELGGADPDRIVVTHGAQQALSLLVEALVDRGTQVVVERTSYIGMLQPLVRCGAVLHAADADADGPLTEPLAKALGGGLRPSMLYAVPTFQNPTGSVMSVARRRQLGRLAAAHGVVVVDDDPYRRLSSVVAPPRMREFVPDELAVSVGSFSKCVAPGLRVGWVHGPSWLVDALVRLKQSADLHTNTIGQRTLVELLGRDGWLEEHTGRVARTLHRRGEILAEELSSSLGALVQVDPPSGGMFLWARFAAEVGDTDQLARAALADGVAIVAGSVFDPLGRPSSGARLGFASSDEAELRVGARRLSRTVLRCAGASVAPSSAMPQR